jgi:hypothetical protein
MTKGTPASVMPVDPEHLRQTVALFEDWFAYTGKIDVETNEREVEGPDLRTMLDSLATKFAIDEGGAIALFKRGLALMGYCGEASLPEALFEDGVPGKVLCKIAAKATVVDVPGETAEEMGHTLDPDEMRKALPNTWN